MRNPEESERQRIVAHHQRRNFQWLGQQGAREFDARLCFVAFAPHDAPAIERDSELFEPALQAAETVFGIERMCWASGESDFPVPEIRKVIRDRGPSRDVIAAHDLDLFDHLVRRYADYRDVLFDGLLEQPPLPLPGLAMIRPSTRRSRIHSKTRWSS